MNRRSIVLGTAALSSIGFVGATIAYGRLGPAPSVLTAPAPEHLLRPHAPVIGPADAPVTVVEFFDPSCEACRAIYPAVKQILAKFPTDVRLVMRYAVLHPGSDEAVRILETARMQGVYQPVLEALLLHQPRWAVHGAPDLNIAWEAAKAAGLDVERAQTDKQKPEIDAVLKQDTEDLRAAKIKGTPTFFVNSKPLTRIGPFELYELVRSEVEAAGRGVANR